MGGAEPKKSRPKLVEEVSDPGTNSDPNPNLNPNPNLDLNLNLNLALQPYPQLFR